MPFSRRKPNTDELESGARRRGVARFERPDMSWPNERETVIEGSRIDELRGAIKANRVSFPEPVPIFPTQFRPEIQWRLVELYFVRGWSTSRLAARYGVTTRRIQQSLQHWAAKAMEGGYLQTIPPYGGEEIPPVNGLPAIRSLTGALAAPRAPGFLPIQTDHEATASAGA
jgi:hypothetical protein